VAEFGVLPEGFLLKTEDQILESMIARLRPTWGASYDFTVDSPDGQLLRTLAREISEGGWQLGQAVYKSRDRDSATGQALAALLLLTGSQWPEAERSTVTLTLTGTAATVVASGSVAKTLSLGDRFETTASGTLAALTAWANTTAYVLGDRRSNGGNSYVCITAGTSAGSGGPTTTAADITDGTVHWRYLGPGAAVADVAARSVETGAILATSGDLTVMETLVSGWQGVINLLDATPGRDRGTDAEARQVAEADVFRAGATVPDAIRQTLLRVTDVTSVTVFYNNTDVTDGDGVPPHAVECLVTGGADQDILDALLAECIAAGIATHSSGAGAVVGTADDDEGVSHAVEFSRPTEVNIYVAVTLVKIAHDDADPETYPTDGDDEVKDAIVAYGDSRPTGWNVRSSKVAAQAEGVAGVLEVTACYIGTAPAPAVSTTIAISTRQRAVFDTGRITVTTSDGTP
jgi:hypothetical protein